MKKNDILEITITDQSVTGEGIGKYRGFPFFVKDAVAGDAVRITVTKLKKSYGYGHLDEVITPSPHRCAPSCGSARVCGGCQLQEMDYAGQLAYKERVVREVPGVDRAALIQPERTFEKLCILTDQTERFTDGILTDRELIEGCR